MSEEIVVTIIIGFNAFMVAIATPFAAVFAKRLGELKTRVEQVDAVTTSVAEKTQAIHNQTVNHHPESPNMREENDGRHAETLRMFGHMDAKLDRTITLQDELVTLGLQNRYMIENHHRRIRAMEDEEKEIENGT